MGRKEEKLAIVFLGLIVAAFGAWIAFGSFIEQGVDPNLAAGYAVTIFIVILGAFGLIAVKVHL